MQAALKGLRVGAEVYTSLPGVWSGGWTSPDTVLWSPGAVAAQAPPALTWQLTHFQALQGF